ncbi:serine/threonine-protein kinase-like protein At3g51990 [Cornus florida]|uniref:serine/threonine-protein kinase-like protein At3g51990 n=1 Tax=Cornus florida TaxID=4283 RepID=UPI00289F8F6F|nr:serine/threonine-protein kinase-like protein At3g51990 [Cornus florida]XP_059651917.1 serine/threonine-protein kinase-like protein At3g51990 [Cornus florida]
MGYLSCKAESSISISDSQTPTSSKKTQQEIEKPIKIQQFEYSDLEAATNGFSDQKLLGRGSHGLVYKAVLRGGRLVAVKKPSRGSLSAPRFSTSSAPESANEVENEIDILSKLHSPRLVNLVGFTSDSRDRLLVVEFMSNGTLYEVLHSSPRPPNWGRRIRLALQTAKAIDTLHSSVPPVIHRDIKSANVLIDRNFNARLGDFGLALRCHVDDFRLRSTPPAGTIGYLDPGYVTPDNLSTKTDVFSFGILLLEIISGRKAIDVGHSPPSIVDWAIPLIRRGKLLAIYDPRIPPPKDPSLRKQLAVIAAKCVRSCKERRPSMKEVAESLGALSKLVPLHSWNGFSNPCLMVETVGRPVESGNAQLNSRPKGVEDGGDAVCARPLRNSRRVYSDLGFRNNLMDLMAGNDEFRGEDDGAELKSKSANGGSSFRIASERFVGRSSRTVVRGNEKGSGFRMRRNQSVGESSELYSRRVDMIIRSSSSARAADFS